MIWKYINRRWNISFWIIKAQDLFSASLRRRNLKWIGLTKSGITFSYGIEITKLWACWKCYWKGYMIVHLKDIHIFFWSYKCSLCWSMVFLSIYGKVKEVLFDPRFLSLWQGEESPYWPKDYFVDLGFEGINLYNNVKTQEVKI